jgi:hypothetical protein
MNRMKTHPDLNARLCYCIQRRRMKLTTIFTMSMLAFAFLLPSISSAQDQRWSEPLKLSADESAWFPDIRTDRFGRVHVVWSSTVTKAEDAIYDVVMYRGWQTDTGWTPAVDIASLKGGGYASRPELSISAKDRLLMSYRNEDGVQFMWTDSLQPWDATNWSKPEMISPYGYFTEVLAGTDGVLHYFFTSNVPTTECPVCLHIFHRMSFNDGLSWSSPQDISLLPTGAAKPYVALDQEGRLHVAWEAGVGGDLGQLLDRARIYYTWFDPNTQEWSTPRQISETDMNARNVALAVSAEDSLIITYFSVTDGGIYYRRSSNYGSSWSAPARMEGFKGVFVTALDRMAMATDSAGDIHLVLIGLMDDQPETEGGLEMHNVIHAVWDGSSWGLVETIARYAGDVPEWPGIAVSEGNRLHVVWYIRDAAHIWQSEMGQYTVWYSTKLTDAPLTPASPLPGSESPPSSESPPPSVSEEEGASSNSTGESTDSGGQVMGGLVQEKDVLYLLGESLIPVIVFIFAGFMFVVLRRK